MAGITGLGTTYNLPNYVGELFGVSPEDTPLLSSIGGLTGGKSINSTIWTWQSYDLRDADDARQRLEGADAPAAEGRARAVGSNVVEIHQEQVQVSDTKLGATSQVSTGGAANVALGGQPVADELAWQLNNEFKQVARDVEKSFITGTYQLPGDNSTARKTRGLARGHFHERRHERHAGCADRDDGFRPDAGRVGGRRYPGVRDPHHRPRREAEACAFEDLHYRQGLPGG